MVNIYKESNCIRYKEKQNSLHTLKWSVSSSNTLGHRFTLRTSLTESELLEAGEYIQKKLNQINATVIGLVRIWRTLKKSVSWRHGAGYFTETVLKNTLLQVDTLYNFLQHNITYMENIATAQFEMTNWLLKIRSKRETFLVRLVTLFTNQGSGSWENISKATRIPSYQDQLLGPCLKCDLLHKALLLQWAFKQALLHCGIQTYVFYFSLFWWKLIEYVKKR